MSLLRAKPRLAGGKLVEFLDKFDKLDHDDAERPAMPKVSISSGEFLKAYGRISETALREPVSITSHGRERLVLLSADEYRRLKENDRTALYPWELGDEDLVALQAAEPPAAAQRFEAEVATK